MTLILSGTDGLSDVDGSAATPAIRGTDANTGIFFGADIIGFSEGGAEVMRINSSGNVGIGTANTPSNRDTVTPKLIVNGAGVAGSMQVVRNTTVGAGGAILELTATRGSDVNSYTILQSGDGVGSVVFGGADGNEFVAAASINAQVDGTPGDNDMPGRLIFSTTADGAATVTERMRIDSSGNVGIGTSSPSSYGRLAVMTPTANYGYFGIANSAGGAGGVNMAQYYGTTKISYIDTTLTNGTPGSETAFLAFATANSGTLAERMRIDSSGNVGIGTSSPSVKLEVSGPVYSAQNNYIRIGNAYLSSGGDYCHLANNTYFNGSVWTSSANGAMYQMTGQTHNWYTQTSNAFTAVAVITSTGNFQFNSGYGSVATAYGCRAWVNFNGTGTVAIRASGNVSSITDIGVGDYTVNFTNAMPDANYAFAGSAAANYANNLTLYIGQDSNDTRSTTQLNFKTIYNNANTAAPDDSPNVNVAVYR